MREEVSRKEILREEILREGESSTARL